MANGSKHRAKVTAPLTATDAEVAMTPPSKGPKSSRSPPYRKTRSQNKDLIQSTQDSGAAEAEGDELEKKKSTTSSAPSGNNTAAAIPAAAAAGDQVEEPGKAARDDVNNTQDKAEEDTTKTDIPSADDNDTNKNKDEIQDKLNNEGATATGTAERFNPTVFRSATSTIQETLALMNAKAAIHANISCDDLDVVYKQFELFMSSHPILGKTVGPMLKAVAISGNDISNNENGTPPTIVAVPLSDNRNPSGGSGEKGNIAGIAANLSSMLTDLEHNVLAAAAAAAGDGDGDGGGSQFPSKSAAMPPLRAGWDAASLLNLPPALASALSNKMKNQPTNAPLSAPGAATTTTTITTGGGAETIVLQEKLRRAIAAAQGGYNNNTYNDLSNTGAAATYNPKMSSQTQAQSQLLSSLNQHELQQLYNQNPMQMYVNQQTSLASGSPEYNCQPSAADSAAIAAATAAALAGHTRAGQDKAPALELLRVLSKINNAEYTSEGGAHTYTTINTINAFQNKNNNNPYQQQQQQQQRYFSPGSYSEEPSDYDGGDYDMEERRSPSPAPINPNTNRPLRKVVVQKAADELAASALVSLGVSMAAAPGPANGSGRKGNKFNRAGIKRTVSDRERERGGEYDAYPSSSPASLGIGNVGGGGGNLKQKGTGTGGNTMGNVIANIEYRPEEGGLVAVGQNSGRQGGRGGGGGGGGGSGDQHGLSDNDVTAKVQLLMLMAQNLGEIQNGGTAGASTAAAAGSDGAPAGDGDDGEGSGDGVVGAASEDVEGEATAA